jgi:hypothetical protein
VGIASVRPHPAADQHDQHQRPAPTLASDKQIELIITLVSRLRSHTSTIDAVGTAMQIQALSTMHDREALRQATPRLTRLDASKLIDRLKALETPIPPVA